MANIFKAKPSVKKQAATNNLVGKKFNVIVNSLDHTGVGVVSTHQPIIFVQGALPGESVDIIVTEQKARYCRADIVKIQQASPDRESPFCQHFNQCGGCQTQHISATKACLLKQASIEHLILHTSVLQAAGKTGQRKKGSLSTRHAKKVVHATIGSFTKQLPWFPIISSPPVGYRRKTRLSMDARNPQNIKLGFRHLGSKQVFSLQQCSVLTSKLQSLIEPLQAVISMLHNPAAIGHISMCEGNAITQVCVRTVKTLSKQDLAKFVDFSQANNVQLALEDNRHHIDVMGTESKTLAIDVIDGVELTLTMNDFVQVNDQVNQQMVAQALEWLSLNPDDEVLDLFCGIGNFSLSIAAQCQLVTGAEGVAEMVQHANNNALKNGIQNCKFLLADLNDSDDLRLSNNVSFNKVLLDPARDGADLAIDSIVRSKPSHILYVSCNPTTFARDAAKLYGHKYQISKIGLMDMFPQTAHTELMALFVPN